MRISDWSSDVCSSDLSSKTLVSHWPWRIVATCWPMARTARKARVRNCWMIRTSGICTWGGESYMSQVNAETLTEGSEEQAAVVPVEGGWLHSRQAMGIEIGRAHV